MARESQVPSALRTSGSLRLRPESKPAWVLTFGVPGVSGPPVDAPPRFGARLFEQRARGGGSIPARAPTQRPEEAVQTRKRADPIGSALSISVFRRCPALPRGLPRSTIGAEELNFRVRNGTGCFPFAIAAGNPMELFGLPGRSSRATQWTRARQSTVQVVRVVSSPRPVSTGQLSALPRLHFRPINPVVWLGALPTRRWRETSS